MARCNEPETTPPPDSTTYATPPIAGLALICHSSYRGVVEFLRDLLGLPVSVGTVHYVL